MASTSPLHFDGPPLVKNISRGHTNNHYLFAGVVLALILASNAVNADITLAENSETPYVIVVSDDAIEPEKTAAKELQTYLEQVTGAKFAITSTPTTGPKILVGPSSRVRKLLANVDWDGLGKEGTVRKTAGRDLILAGGRPRGTLYAVYSFLEDTVGCRWWTSTESTIPKSPTLRVPQLDKLYIPPFSYRLTWNFDNGNKPLFRAKQKINSGEQIGPVPGAYGGSEYIINDGHGLGKMITAKQYFEDHPEWFRYSRTEGKRVLGEAVDQVVHCYTNQALRTELTRVVLGLLKQHEGASNVIDVSLADSGSMCECDPCIALRRTESADSGVLVHFLNGVAEEVEKFYPDAKLTFLGYWSTNKPPNFAKPHRNLVPRVATMDKFHDRSVRQYKLQRRYIEKWSAISSELFIWDYAINFHGYLLPHPNLMAFNDTLRFYAEHKVTSVFLQAHQDRAAYFPRLRMYLYSKLMWNPHLDGRKIIKQFMYGYFGAAAPHMLSVIDLFERAGQQPGVFLNCYYKGTYHWLRPRDLFLATKLWARAEQAVRNDEVLAQRVLRARLPMDMVYLNRHRTLKRYAYMHDEEFRGPKHPYTAAERYIKTAGGFGANNSRMGVPFGALKSKLLSRYPRPADTPAQCRGLHVAEWEDIQDNMFSLGFDGGWTQNFQHYTVDELAQIVDDPAASDGKAARMPGGHRKEAVKYVIDREMAGRWHVYVVGRIDAPKYKEMAFIAGIYHRQDIGEMARIVPAYDPTKSKAYETYYLGVHDLLRGAEIWVTPPEDETIKSVYIDRIFLIRDGAQKKMIQVSP